MVRDGRAMKVDFVVVGLSLWIILYSVASSGYKSRVLLVTGCVGAHGDMSLFDCA